MLCFGTRFSSRSTALINTCGSLGHSDFTADTGLIYMRARWYDPVTGSFISEDPAGDGVNWYSYCAGNPVNAVDPTGEMAEIIIGGGIMAGEAAYGAFVTVAGFAALAGVMAIIAGHQIDMILANHQAIGISLTNRDENKVFGAELKKRGIDPRSDLGRSIHDIITKKGLTAQEIGEIADSMLQGSRKGQKNKRGGRNESK